MPNVLDMPVDEAIKLLKNLGLHVEVIGEGDSIVKQFPNPGSDVKYNTIIYLELG